MTVSYCVRGGAQDANRTESRVVTQPRSRRETQRDRRTSKSWKVKYRVLMVRGRSLTHFTHFWHKNSLHLQLIFSDPVGKPLKVVTMLAGIDTMLHAVFYSSLEISDSTLNNPFGTKKFQVNKMNSGQSGFKSLLSSGAETPFKDCSSSAGC